jgi:hypothetical protein
VILAIRNTRRCRRTGPVENKAICSSRKAARVFNGVELVCFTYLSRITNL